jgi:hypothetical protein
VNAGEDVLVFYNDKASFNHFVEMMRSERHRMDEGSALRFVTKLVLRNLVQQSTHLLPNTSFIMDMA